MADHGITGTHHIDGTQCTMTAACPWTMSQGHQALMGFLSTGIAPPTNITPVAPAPASPGGHVSTNPISVEMVREDWIDHPTLTKSQKQILESLTDQQINDAVSEAMLGYTDVWHNMLDEVRGTATRHLLTLVPSADDAPEGTDDECTNCGLPIGRKGGAWVDAFMGSADCSANQDEKVHTPKAVLTAYMKALKKGAKITAPTPGTSSRSSKGGAPILVVATTDGSAREDGNVYYCAYLLVDVDESHRQAVHAALASLVAGRVGQGGNTVEFKSGNNTVADELFDDPDDLANQLTQLGFPARSITASFLTQDR